MKIGRVEERVDCAGHKVEPGISSLISIHKAASHSFDHSTALQVPDASESVTSELFSPP